VKDEIVDKVRVNLFISELLGRVRDRIEKSTTKRLGPFNDQSIRVVFGSQAKLGRGFTISVEGGVVGSTESSDRLAKELKSLFEGSDYFSEGSGRCDDDIGKLGCSDSFFGSRLPFGGGPDVVNELVEGLFDHLLIESTDWGSACVQSEK
jgi:hypothetical protein